MGMNRLTSGGNISDTDIFRHPGNLFGVLFFMSVRLPE
ncbi:hypothetical protein M115_3342 [Bacteroides fragilis str. 3719 T6]|nr:hypothetical protein M115_3342 [Bacteroides fragilis str. 3719 T6]